MTRQVVALMSRTLHDLVVGELQQLTSKGCDRNDRFNNYLRKTYNKTASLMANSCQAVAQIAAASNITASNTNKNDVALAAFSYGKNLGIAFQLIDDFLDFSASATSLGKPAAADLKSVLMTFFISLVTFKSDHYFHQVGFGYGSRPFCGRSTWRIGVTHKTAIFSTRRCRSSFPSRSRL